MPRGHYKLRFGERLYMHATHPGITLNSAARGVRTIVMPTTPVPDDMVFIPGGAFRLGAWGFVDETDLGGYLIDRHEVSNRDFQAFVDAGGYRNPSYWQRLIEDSGGRLDWTLIAEQFVDRTGRPDPAGWEIGSYLPGEADLPVVGVSWYEASAYLASRDKVLPSVHHWLRATLGPAEWKYPFAPHLVPRSNLDADSLLAVNRSSGAEVNGAFDLIGNAAEWTSTPSRGAVAVTGASYRDPPWAYNFPHPGDPFRRDDVTGLRGMRLIPGASAKDLPPLDLFDDFSADLRRVSDAEFSGIRHSFAYPSGLIDASDVTVVAESSHDQWVRREIRIPTGRERDPLPVHLFLPRRHPPPWQSVIYMPPTDSWSPGFRSESISLENYQLDFVPRSGRVLIWPVYSGSHERYDDFHADPGPERSSLALERNRRVRDEVGRIIDYLQSDPQFDGERVAMMGLSHGATLAAFSLATEKRLRAAILCSIGIAPPLPLFANPQNDPNVFWARVELPVLVINGRYDPIRPHRFVLEPLIDLLATPPAMKKSILYDAGHWPLPRHQFFRDSLEWLDRYLGPVAPPPQ